MVPQFLVWTFALVWLVDERGWTTAAAGSLVGASQVLAALGRIAVHRDGRVKAFESYAREMMAFVTGGRAYLDRPALVTYLDLMLRPEAYADADIIWPGWQ